MLTKSKKNGCSVLGVAISLVAVAPACAASLVGYATLNGGTTGGQGGDVVYATTGTEINEAMCNRASVDTPLIIYVSGTINHDNTEKISGSCDTTGEEIQFKKVSNLSLIGTGGNALLDEIGIHIRESSNIIIQNLHISNVKKSGSPVSNGGDAIGMEKDVFNIWVDHNELEASGGEDDGYDSLIDMKNTTQYVTVSYNYLHNSGRGGLMGSSDTDSNNTYVTFHHNWYDTVDSRIPLLRYGTAHAYNNYYSNVSKSAMNPRIGGSIKAENNHFENVNNPIGTFYTDDMGSWDPSGNIFEDVTWSSSEDEHPAGPDPVSTTTVTIPYSYQVDDADCVRSIVKAAAGIDNDLLESDGSCDTQSGDDTETDSSDSGDDSGSTDSGDVTETDNSDSGNDSGSTDSGDNLSLGAGSDGSSKGVGSYSSVRDGDMTTYWAPNDDTGRISIKWSSDESINTVIIGEASEYEGNIGDWTLENDDSGAVLASGNGAGTIRFSTVTLEKINFNINSSSGTPTVAEFETYYAQ